MSRRSDEFERVAMPHAAALLRSAAGLTRDVAAAEDLVQESLLRAWRSFDQFQPGTNVRAWLFRILVNAFHEHNRKVRSSSPTAALAPGAHPTFNAGVEFIEVNQALDRLAADHRTVLMLAVVEGFTCREIADILAAPIGTVMSRLSRAREAMRESLSAGSRTSGEEVIR